jgi:hypothetical protein
MVMPPGSVEQHGRMVIQVDQRYDCKSPPVLLKKRIHLRWLVHLEHLPGRQGSSCCLFALIDAAVEVAAVDGRWIKGLLTKG